MFASSMYSYTVDCDDVTLSFMVLPYLSTSFRSARVEEIAVGHQWTEGPLFIEDDSSSLNYLIFSDTKENRILRWEEGKGLFTVGESIFMENSGCSRTNQLCQEQILEPGSNGLVRVQSFDQSAAINLIAAQHGERSVTLLFDNGTRVPIASHYDGKRLNSPNDLVWSDLGHLYFTDPVYGLVGKDLIGHPGMKTVENQHEQPKGKELDHSGVYMVKSNDIVEAINKRKPSEKVHLMDASMTTPNGLAFNPRFSRLYVVDSVPAVIKVFEVHPDDGSLSNARIFYNSSETKNRKWEFLDGIKVDSNGNVYVAASGYGVLILDVTGSIIGTIKTEVQNSNLVISPGGWIYITAGSSVMRVRTLAKPAGLSQPPKGSIAPS